MRVERDMNKKWLQTVEWKKNTQCTKNDKNQECVIFKIDTLGFPLIKLWFYFVWKPISGLI